MKDYQYFPDNITSLLSSPIELVLNTDIIILESDKFADEAIKLMKERNARSILASHNGEVIGIVSKTDILFKIMSQGRNPAKVRLREIMNSPGTSCGPKSDGSRSTFDYGQTCSKTNNSKFKCSSSWNDSQR